MAVSLIHIHRDPMDRDLITSKELLETSGISRATLHNYIKLGILPRPIVQKPKYGMKGTKKIGYFPAEALDFLRRVKKLKREGHSIEDIAKRFREVPTGKVKGEEEASPHTSVPAHQIRDQELRVTFEDMPLPAYLLNDRFEVQWINGEAEKRIFKQMVGLLKDGASRNVFRLFFNWEFHYCVRNWRDLIAFHMSFVKARFARTWIGRVSQGISEREISILNEAYDKVLRFPIQGIRDVHVHFLLNDGTTESYRVYCMSFMEGILFIYAPTHISYFGQGHTG